MHLTLAEYGADVAITFRSSVDAANEVKEEIEEKGRNAKAIQADAVKFDSAEEVISEIIDEWDKLDILVNNAGITKDNLILAHERESSGIK
ncbi:MAG: SDR family NAD(P)-dependent oxidoreductase [Fodinibius sp.]|nr:SDR family NAD(P)-dependent oxidoreductase [Fodinibius sp.]